MHEITIRIAALEDVAAMAQLRETGGWQGGAGAETMCQYLAGEHHPQQALAARAAFVAELLGKSDYWMVWPYVAIAGRSTSDVQ